MASQIGSGLTGVLYVLDEPSIGLHQKDNIKLIDALKRLRDLGNTVIVVEHDTETMENSDHIIDLDPKLVIKEVKLLLKELVMKLKKIIIVLLEDILSNKSFIQVPKNRKIAKNGRYLRNT